MDPHDYKMEVDDEEDQLHNDGDDDGSGHGPVFDLLMDEESCPQAPSARLYTAKELHTLIHEGVIDLNPSYQREVVWAPTVQTKLLDSLWRDFYVPPIVFSVTEDEDGEEVRRCVDGKQRLTAIQKFFDGQIAYKHWKTNHGWWYTASNTQKKSRSVLPPEWKAHFCNKTITCVEYRNLSPELEREIFRRVQMGKPLVAAEKLKSNGSPRVDFVDQLVYRYVEHEDNLAKKIDVNTSRAQDFRILAGFAYSCEQYPEQSYPTTGNIDKWLTGQDTLSEQFRASIIDTLTAFWHIANTPGLNTGFKDIPKRVAPVEFIYIGVLLYALRDASYETRADAIYDMRVYIRKKFPDIRLRNDIMKQLWIFIEDAVERASDEPSSSKTNKGKKVARRNGIEDDMENEDRRSSKKQRKGK